MWAGTLLILPLGAGVPGAVVRAGAEPLLAVALLALGASAVGFFAWAFALRASRFARVSAALYAVPVVAILVAFAWLGELPSAASVAGGAIALAGVALATGYTFRREPSGRVRSRRGDPGGRRRADLRAAARRGGRGGRSGSAARTRVAVTATRRCETCVAVVGALAAGVPIVPINPKAGERELRAHPVRQRARRRARRRRPRRDRRLAGRARTTRRRRSSSTRPARPGRRRASCCRAARSRRTSTRSPTRGTGRGDDVVAHALPLFHVHGLILGMLGPLRRGGAAWHLGRFSPAAAAEALDGRATMLFGVPTMYHRLAADLEADPGDRARAGRRAAAGLRLRGAPGRRPRAHRAGRRASEIVERYGMSETLMNTAIRADGERRPGTVGPPLPASSCGWSTTTATCSTDDETVGEIQVRGAEPVPRVPQPPGRDARRRSGRLVRHRRRRPRATTTATSGSSAGARPT